MLISSGKYQIKYESLIIIKQEKFQILELSIKINKIKNIEER